MITLSFIGTPEIVVILIIALLVFGPQKLPEIGQQIGSLYRELNRMRGDVTRALDIDEYTRYDGRDLDSNPYTSGYSYDTPADHRETGLHDGLEAPQIAASSAESVPPPGPSGTVASHSPFTAPSAEAEFERDLHESSTSLSANTAAQIYTQPEQGDASPAPSHKEPNQP